NFNSGAEMTSKYYVPRGGHPGQEQLLTDRAVFTTAYAVIPKSAMQDIVTSFLPFWERTRLWVLSRPLSGFPDACSQDLVEVAPGGVADRPETEHGGEAVIFVVEGTASLAIRGQQHELQPGGYAYLPPRTEWTLHNTGQKNLCFHRIKKPYEA